MNSKIFFDDKRLVKILSKAHIDRHQVFSHQDFIGKKTKMTRLFELLRDNEYESMDELKSALYDKKAKADTNFRKLYSGFQSKLCDTILLLDLDSNELGERGMAYHKCVKSTLLVRYLFSLGLYEKARKVSEESLLIAEKYEFVAIAKMLCGFLCSIYSSTILDKKKCFKYELIFDRLNKEEETENDLKLSHTKLSIWVHYNKVPSLNFIFETLRGTYEKYVKILENRHLTIDALNSIIEIFFEYCFYSKKLEELVSWSDLLLQEMNKKGFSSPGASSNMLMRYLQLLLLLKDYKKAIRIYNEQVKFFIIGNHNWFTCHIYFILNLLHGRYYGKAHEIISQCMRYSTFRKQLQNVVECFLLFEAFLETLLLYKKEIGITPNPKFKMSKFVNQVPIMSKDKYHFNISVIVVQILYLLVKRKYSAIIDRIESLQQYAYRHLRKDETYRSQCFIKLIVEMTRADFKKQGTIFRSRVWLERLNSVSLKDHPTSQVEIVPYEHLWEMILEKLD